MYSKRSIIIKKKKTKRDLCGYISSIRAVRCASLFFEKTPAKKNRPREIVNEKNFSRNTKYYRNRKEKNQIAAFFIKKKMREYTRVEFDRCAVSFFLFSRKTDCTLVCLDTTDFIVGFDAHLGPCV